jgi:epoxyqueuosine reductase
MDMWEELLSQLEEQGYQGRIVSTTRLGALQGDIEGHYRQGLLDQELYQTYLAKFAFSPPDTLPGARSIIVVAVPQPQTRVTFAWNGDAIRWVIPPTYPERETEKRVWGLLTQALEPAGYQVAQALLPKKLLAVRSGLATYGRNNISYVPGMGSFHGLVAAYSDLPAPEGNLREPQMLDACQKCSACLHHCPAGAITAERFLLHAERCITFHNEKPGEVPFPAWMDPSWHNCLVGCLYCQRVCPQNRQRWQWYQDGEDFSQEETALLLDAVPFDQLPRALAEKLEGLEMDSYADVLSRNMNALLSQRR